jgi:hypothetical protein
MDVSSDVALKNAWTSAIAAADELKAVSLDPVDLDVIQPKVLAQAIAAQALRGLVEQLRRTAEKAE